MLILRHSKNIPNQLTGATVVIGNFDGVHRGHQAVIGQAAELSNKSSTPLVALTFEPHPKKFFSPKSEPFRLTPFRAKVVQLAALGVEATLVIQFNKEFSQLTAKDFINRVLIDGLHAKRIVVGYDFSFGSHRSGNAELLNIHAKSGAFEFEAIKPVTSTNNIIFSSTAVRKHIMSGKPGHAASLLGRPFEIEGRVIHGDKIGRTLGFPTANILLRNYLRPAFGIYAVRVGTKNAGVTVWHDAVANVGVRPTVGGTKPLLEPHIFNFRGNLYGKRIRVAFVEYLRAEEHYETLGKMVEQIEKDCSLAKRILKTPAIGVP